MNGGAQASGDSPTSREESVVEEQEAPEARTRLPFAPLTKVLAEVLPEPAWILPGYLARESLTLLAGRPKVGKSTFLFALLAALSREEGVFLERRLAPAGALLLTEERRQTLWQKVQQFPFERARVDLLLRQQAGGTSWRNVVAQALEHCHKQKRELLVVDTLADWAGLAGDQENDAGAALAALRPLQDAAGAGLAVLVLHHQRKADGGITEAIRGSNALSGGVDIVVGLEQKGNVGDRNARLLRAVSRFRGTPSELVITLSEDGYEVAGGSLFAAREESEKERILQALADNHVLTAAELAHETELRETTARRRADALVEEGKLVRRGAGKKGDPIRWSLPDSSTTPTPLPAGETETAPEEGELT